jgi:hypothetical protein
MTRETKVGVVVCLSFLCLVGVVLGTKMRGDPTEEDEVIEIPQPVAVATNTNPPAAAIPTQAGNGNGPEVIPTVAVQNAQPLPPPPVRTEITDAAAPKNNSLDLPPPPVTKETATAPAPTSVTAISEPSAAQNQTRDDVIYIPFFGMLPKSALVAASESTEEPVDIAALLGGQTDKPKSDGIPGPKDVPPPTTADGKATPAPDTVKTVPMPTNLAPQAEARGNNPGQARPIPLGDALQADPAKPTKPDDVKLTVAPPPPATSANSAGAVLMAPKSPTEVPPRTEPGAVSLEPTRAPAGAAPVRPGQPIVQASATDNPRRIGAAPTATTPAISVPVPGSITTTRPATPTRPQVESWDEETYRVKPGDTFDQISMAHFNTKNYGDALRRFNVTHPQATERMRADPPNLEAGEFIYIPPAYILEKRHGVALIPGYKPQSEAASANDTPRTSNSSPRTSPTSKDAADYKLYRVSPSGQNMREIARAALGNPDKWNDIYNLNPALDPAYAVRGSTTIKVPAEANVPAANVPPPETR